MFVLSFTHMDFRKRWWDIHIYMAIIFHFLALSQHFKVFIRISKNYNIIHRVWLFVLLSFLTLDLFTHFGILVCRLSSCEEFCFYMLVSPAPPHPKKVHIYKSSSFDFASTQTFIQHQNQIFWWKFEFLLCSDFCKSQIQQTALIHLLVKWLSLCIPTSLSLQLA